MKKIFIGMIVFSSLAFAQTGNQSLSQLHKDSAAILGQGNVEVGGSVGLNYTSYNGTSTYLNPRAEYFFSDELAVGGTFRYSTNNYGSSIGLGPSMSYYFWKKDKMAAYAGGDVIYSRYSGAPDGNIYVDGKLGMNYFLTPSVAFGPQLNLSSITTSSQSADLSFTFAIYL